VPMVVPQWPKSVASEFRVLQLAILDAVSFHLRRLACLLSTAIWVRPLAFTKWAMMPASCR
jgi:hypothetical protein